MTTVIQRMTLGQATAFYYRRLRRFQFWMTLRSDPRYKSSPEEEGCYQRASRFLKELADYLWENGINVYA